MEIFHGFGSTKIHTGIETGCDSAAGNWVLGR
jgi:hypothetical protein